MRLTRRAAIAAIFSILLLAGCGLYGVAGTTIDRITCELVRSGMYRIEFTQSTDSGRVAIYTSTSPDKVDLPGPIVSDAHSPVDISLPDDGRRIYFHLKPTNGRPRVTAVRRLPLDGAINFRDVGGYPTSDGRFVRWGVVYRSEQLSGLTPNDYAYLNRLGLR